MGGSGSGGELLAYESDRQIVDIVEHAGEVVVVYEDGAIRFDADGVAGATWDSSKDVTAAAVGGDYVVVADLAALNVLDGQSLALVAEIDLVESCGDIVVRGEGLVACGSMDGENQHFQMFSLSTFAALGVSQDIIHAGVHMAAMGDDSLFATSFGNPPRMDLYQVSAGAEVVRIGESALNDFGPMSRV